MLKNFIDFIVKSTVAFLPGVSNSDEKKISANFELNYFSINVDFEEGSWFESKRTSFWSSVFERTIRNVFSLEEARERIFRK